MGSTVLDRFHPAVAQWFRQRFGAPTEAQARAWPVTAGGGHALIAAPTGSGKTLAAFLSAIDQLVVEGLERGLRDEVYVLYVSPLKALSNDIQKNLQQPLAGIRDALLERGLPDVAIRDAVRTGDTPQSERERMRRVPPHILVTTPESLYILLTSDSGRRMLGRVRSVIVDELHALAGNKRGAHLMLSLERLEALIADAGGAPPVRIGLSATVKPVEEMARFLVGCHPERSEGSRSERDPSSPSAPRDDTVTIIDTGHIRERDLALELPESPLETVMSNEVWGELYDRLAGLIRQHRTTLIFVNQRRLAERAARQLAERIGEEHVTAHHGSLAREHRLKAEQRLKGGELKALVATSSLELGIDIGEVDLVCQLGSPRSIAAFLQRVGRAGHAIGAIPKGRLFPLSQDDLTECAALLDSARRGELDRIVTRAAPLDVLAQQVAAEVSCREWDETELYDTLRRALPYRDLPRAAFDQVVQMLADGYATRRGRRGAHLHHDAVNRRLRGRRGARLVAVTNGGVIPDQFDYDVVLMPEGHRVGTLNEDFSFESVPGDIFQLGNTSWRILKVETGRVLVEDARGQPPTLPFWLGEAPGRTPELSASVSRLNSGAEAQLEQGVEFCERWLEHEVALPRAAAQQLAAYFASSRLALAVLPTLDTLVLERFFDEVGDTHLVIHSPYGSRVNRAWGLALRKRFCRQFNFELQASALEDSIVLSLGPSHSFPLDDVTRFLNSATAREVLVQALLDAPMFGTRWRWNATTALAVRRMINGKKAPPQFQRSDSEDLLTVVFPDQVACAENLRGDREIPDHPLVRQALDDCLHEVMDVDGFLALLRRIESGEVKVVARDLAAPSPLAHAILNARPYAFLDDGAAEERRTRLVATHRLMDLETAAAVGSIAPEALERLRTEIAPEPASADELHDALVVHGYLTRDEGKPWRASFDALVAQRRATVVQAAEPLWVAAERLAELRAVLPEAGCDPVIAAVKPAPASADEALRELVRGRLELLGPVTSAQLSRPLGLDAAPALVALEAEGAVMRMQCHPERSEGSRSERDPSSPSAPRDDTDTWCERRLLARLNRYTRERQRSEVQAVPPAQFMRFLFRWQGLAGAATDERREGEAGLLAVLRQLEGFSVPAGAWEDEVLAPRVRHYLPDLLDRLCATGAIAWFRPAGDADPGRRSGPVRTTPIVLCARDALVHWIVGAAHGRDSRGHGPLPQADAAPSSRAQKVREALRAHGASFFDDLAHDTGLLRSEVEQGLGELVSQGLATCDTFAGLRALIVPAERREKLRRYRRSLAHEVDTAGRWSLPRAPRLPEPAAALGDPAVEHVARALLRRYGVVFRTLLAREDHLPPWRELFYVYRRLEARGEIRGGRFVTGFSGEQFALPEAAGALRKAADPSGDSLESVPIPADEELVSISAADPLNLVGVVVPGEKVPALSGNRVLFRNGVPVAAQSGDDIKFLQPVESKSEWEIRNLLIRRQRPGGYVEPSRTTQ